MDRSRMCILQNAEAVVRRCSIKQAFLKILQNSQIHEKQLCRSLFFNRVPILEACNFIKTENPAHVLLCELLQTFRKSSNDYF